jgi:hypothetical protein
LNNKDEKVFIFRPFGCFSNLFAFMACIFEKRLGVAVAPVFFIYVMQHSIA